MAEGTADEDYPEFLRASSPNIDDEEDASDVGEMCQDGIASK